MALLHIRIPNILVSWESEDFRQTAYWNTRGVSVFCKNKIGVDSVSSYLYF